jgi:hypothetical protein
VEGAAAQQHATLQATGLTPLSVIGTPLCVSGYSAPICTQTFQVVSPLGFSITVLIEFPFNAMHTTCYAPRIVLDFIAPVTDVIEGRKLRSPDPEMLVHRSSAERPPAPAVCKGRTGTDAAP